MPRPTPSIYAPVSSPAWPVQQSLYTKDGFPFWNGEQFEQAWRKKKWPALLEEPAFRSALTAVAQVGAQRLLPEEEEVTHAAALDAVRTWGKAGGEESFHPLNHVLALAARCSLCVWPHWKISSAVAKFISLITPPPNLNYLPEQLPFPALVLEVPEEAGLFLPSPEGRDIPVEAILLGQSLHVGEGLDGLKAAPGMGGKAVLLIGVALGGRGGGGQSAARSDRLGWFDLMNVPSEDNRVIPAHTRALQDFVKVFLMLHAARYFRTELRKPGSKREKQGTRKNKQKISVIHLLRGVLRPSDDAAVREEGPGVSPHWVRGHWHSYWVKHLAEARERRADMPGSLLVVGQEVRSGESWYRVAYLILPYQKGVDEPEPKMTYVKR